MRIQNAPVDMTKYKSKHHRAKKQSGTLNPPQVRVDMRTLIRSGHFRFAVAFILSCIGLYSIIFFMPADWLKPVNEHTARALGYTLNILGIPVTIVSDTVSGGALAFKIIPECTALLMTGLLISFTAFYPSPLRDKITGLAVGIPFLYLGNLFRLVVVFMVSCYDRRFFEAAHVYLGQVFTIFLIILTCIFWLKWLDRQAPKKNISWKIAGFLGRFAVISGSMFFVWMEFHHWYVRFIDWCVTFGFSLFDWRLIIPRNMAVYYETFNYVTFTSLILGTPSTAWKGRLKGFAVGLSILFLFHLLHRIDNALVSAFGLTAVLPIDYVLCAFGQYVLPFLLWLATLLLFQHRNGKPAAS